MRDINELLKLPLEDLNDLELKEIDKFYAENVHFALTLDNSAIKKMIDTILKKLQISSFLHEIKMHFLHEEIFAKVCFNEDCSQQYAKYYELAKSLNLSSYKFGTALADYYNEFDKETAMKYYKECFKPGFDLTNDEYYYSLVKYLENQNKNPVLELTELIDNSPNENEVSLDFVNTLQLRIINLEKDDSRYIKYIDESIIPSTILARKIQNDGYEVDTDEERNLCELLALKLEYYVINEDYPNALHYYNELTDEILRSECTRYYHARDKFYNDMIKELSKTHKELEFLLNMKDSSYEILNKFENLNELKEITLKNKHNKTFTFKVSNAYEDHLTLIPTLLEFGSGAKYYLSYKKENGKNILYY